jgi:hypothetical protein
MRQAKSRTSSPEYVEVPAAAIEAEVIAEEATPSEMPPQHNVFAMPGPVAEKADGNSGSEHQQVFAMSGPVAEVEAIPAKTNPVDTADSLNSLADAISSDRAPASVTIYEEAPQVPRAQAPEPQVYAMPGPVAREHAASFETAQVELENQAYFESQTTADSAPQGQDAWDSLSSILANAAAKEGTPVPVPAPAPAEHHSLAESLPQLPRSNSGLKLSLFGAHEDDEREFENGSNHSGEHHMTEEQEEERRNRLASIRGLRNSS